LADQTSNFGLTKPTEDDFYDISVFNNNADMIDRELKNRQIETERTQSVREIVLTVAGWSSVFPYTQTITVSGVTVNDRPIPGIIYPDSCTRSKQKAINKAAGYIYDIETGSGQVTVRCTQKPNEEIRLGLKGVV